MRWINNRRVVRFFALSLLIFYAISLSSPFVGVALADWEPPTPYEAPDDTYIPPDPYEAPDINSPTLIKRKTRESVRGKRTPVLIPNKGITAMKGSSRIIRNGEESGQCGEGWSKWSDRYRQRMV